MRARLPFWTLASEPYQALRSITAYLHRASLDDRLLELVFLRISQINGCAYCIDMHAEKARALGERQQRLDALPAWHESRFFSERERAALTWAEAVNAQADAPVPEALLAATRQHFSEQETVDLTVAVALITAWNRLCGSLGMEPPERL